MLRLVITEIDLRFLRDVSLCCTHVITEDMSGIYHTVMVTYRPLMRALQQCGRSPFMLEALPQIQVRVEMQCPGLRDANSVAGNPSCGTLRK